MVLVIGLAALSSNSYICLGLIRYYGSFLKTWQTVFINFLSIKPYLIAQVLVNNITIILFLSVYCIMKELLQKRFFDMKDKKIIRLFFCFWKALFFFLVNIFNIIYIKNICNYRNFSFFQVMKYYMPFFFTVEASSFFHEP